MPERWVRRLKIIVSLGRKLIFEVIRGFFSVQHSSYRSLLSTFCRKFSFRIWLFTIASEKGSQKSQFDHRRLPALGGSSSPGCLRQIRLSIARGVTWQTNQHRRWRCKLVPATAPPSSAKPAAERQPSSAKTGGGRLWRGGGALRMRAESGGCCCNDSWEFVELVKFLDGDF